MPVRRMVDDQFRNDTQPTTMGRTDKCLEVPQRPVTRMNIEVICYVIAIVPKGGRIKGKKPDRRRPKLLDIVELRRKTRKIAKPIPKTKKKTFDMKMIDDGVLVPERIVNSMVIDLHLKGEFDRRIQWSLPVDSNSPTLKSQVTVLNYPYNYSVISILTCWHWAIDLWGLVCSCKSLRSFGAILIVGRFGYGVSSSPR